VKLWCYPRPPLKNLGNFSEASTVYDNRARLDPPWEDSVGVATVYPVVHHDVALDVALVERHRCGDLQAFDEVYERFGEMIYNLALRLAANREEAADLTQEIFLRIYRHLGSFGGRSTLKTWVFRIAINHCRDRLSRHYPATQSIDDEAEEGSGVTIADPGRGPEELAVAADEGRRVMEGLSRVPPVFREAVVLRDLEGLSYEEIAEVLGVRVGTVRSRIARGREQLRVLLERQV
jgi:RNA polymerase sigma-70 factor (ECF subfamily)